MFHIEGNQTRALPAQSAHLILLPQYPTPPWLDPSYGSVDPLQVMADPSMRTHPTVKRLEKELKALVFTAMDQAAEGRFFFEAAESGDGRTKTEVRAIVSLKRVQQWFTLQPRTVDPLTPSDTTARWERFDVLPVRPRRTRGSLTGFGSVRPSTWRCPRAPRSV